MKLLLIINNPDMRAHSTMNNCLARNNKQGAIVVITLLNIGALNAQYTDGEEGGTLALELRRDCRIKRARHKLQSNCLLLTEELYSVNPSQLTITI